MSDKETAFRNARILLRSEVVHGTLLIRGGRIAAIDQDAGTPSAAEDWEGDLLLPGLVELHTDNLEKHIVPRPGVWWPVLSALVSHDAQLAAAGITTVLDSIAVGDPNGEGMRARMLHQAVAGLDQACDGNLLRIRHLLHLRCEVASKTVLEDLRAFIAHPKLRLVSLMDHTPGQRQWIDLDKYRRFYQGRNFWSDVKTEEMIVLQRELQARYADSNRRGVVALARDRGVPLASHDDTTVENVAQALEHGVTMSEFPTTVAAARMAHDHGLGIIAGGPNLVRGESHSGNVSALELAELGLVDAISSDYMPSSLLAGAFRLYREKGFTLPEAIATVSRHPARMVGLGDRGEIAPGLRADVIRVNANGAFPVVRAVYCAGERVG